MVNAQQARRVLDRLVGFELSPVLWRKVKQGLSAGRVQSVAVRLIVERENEIANFTSGVTTNKIVFDVRATSISIDESLVHQSDIINRVDVLGRNIIDANFMINIYEDGVIEKKYILK